MNKETLEKQAKGYFEANEKASVIYATKSGHFFWDRGDRNRFVSQSGNIEKPVDFHREEKVKADIIQLPSDIPGFDAIVEHGIKTIDELKALEKFTIIKGVGDATAEEIETYLKSIK